jgi:hypothetical protein
MTPSLRKPPLQNENTIYDGVFMFQSMAFDLTSFVWRRAHLLNLIGDGVAPIHISGI